MKKRKDATQDIMMGFRLTPEEAQQLDEYHQSVYPDLTRSQLVRRIIRQAIKESK